MKRLILACLLLLAGAVPAADIDVEALKETLRQQEARLAELHAKLDAGREEQKKALALKKKRDALMRAERTRLGNVQRQ